MTRTAKKSTKPESPKKTPKESTNEEKPRFKLIDSQEFNELKCDLEWLVEGILVKGEPGVIGGPKKTLKTSLMVDMAISLGTGSPFLGKFAIPKSVPVAVFSGESSKGSLQDTARRVARNKGVALDRHCHVHWESDLPRLLDPGDRRALRETLRDAKIKVVFLDPLYLCLRGGKQSVSASNLYEVGPALRQVARACLAAGATPVLLHHATKTAGKTADGEKPLDLDGLAFAGIGEFVRQWVLLNRTEEYDVGSGRHRLLMSAGGSAGHSDCWRVDVDEGLLKADFGGRKWHVTISGDGLEPTKTSKGSANGALGGRFNGVGESLAFGRR